ncbi:DNA-binding response regulator [Candidatus Symbiopectobacterium sp. 'North America']|uniref:tetrathionate respiration response regulator TtrR n=1 Tax=Candidatus Symbiopectobacterium sp. 'North America' TaxID=2794574 RepID=UPI0018C922C9|nr:tetrathionate respiration response regulator TtrR [Candidatus Symbiopectobacterium sp. 'North America']MBG6245336.1 DNA-binding response regulator [Candidatus Symbiopectobacterium sp. 'North America']
MPMIHLVDDDVAVTEACQFLLESMDYSVTCWHSAEPFLSQAALHDVGVVLLDMRMPEMDGQQVYAAMRQQRSTLAVIFLSGHGDVPMAVTQIKQGAVDFLQKPVAVAPLTTALAQAFTVSTDLFVCHQIRCCYAELTPKERELASYVVQGLINREIAEKMHIALRTVEVHRARVMEKMQADSLASLVNKFYKTALA